MTDQSGYYRIGYRRGGRVVSEIIIPYIQSHDLEDDWMHIEWISKKRFYGECGRDNGKKKAIEWMRDRVDIVDDLAEDLKSAIKSYLSTYPENMRYNLDSSEDEPETDEYD